MIFVIILFGVAFVLAAFHGGLQTNCAEDDCELPDVNPSTGLPMSGIHDSSGNPFGSSGDSMFDDD